MSASDNDPAPLVAHSPLRDPVAALREALSAILRGLVAAGCGPHHLTGMVWESADPAAFHPARHEVDLAWREVFAGFRPLITLRTGANEGLTVRASFAPPAAPPPAEPVHAGYSLPELARQYSPRLQTDMEALFRQWSEDGQAFRAHHRGLDLAYGPGVYERLDLYRPQGAGRAPLWVFLHGGYWQASDKTQHAQFAKGMLDAGYAVAMPNYGLAPDTPLTIIVDQVGAALRFLAREADSLGIDPKRIHLAGHSAGGHLAAMAVLDPQAPPVRSALLLSGLFDLAPLRFLPLGRLLGLDDPALAARLSPLGHPPPRGLRISVAVGEKESDEFKRQSRAIAEAWGAPAPLIATDRHHFSLLEELNGGALLDLALATATG